MYKLIMVNGIEYDYFIGDVKCSDTELYNNIMCKPFLNIIDKNGNTILVNIKYMFFHELNVHKWEDITYSRDNVILLKQICNDYKPIKKLF